MIAKLPPMGWNSWNTFAANISEALILETARTIAESPLRECGYEYVVIDDCWAQQSRGEDGRLRADPDKFPHGIRYVADAVHALGLKLGIYSCAGSLTCAGYPGSYDREFIDAETFASWGVDLLKYDYCFHSSTTHGSLLYRRMGTALACSGRDILFSACTGGLDQTAEWIKTAGAHMWRSTPDILDNWQSIRSILLAQDKYLPLNGAGCFNDMDMLVVGMNGHGHVGLGGCTQEEYKTHFSAWALFGSPLMIGCDVRHADADAMRILTNRDVIGIDRDPAYCVPYRIGEARMNEEDRRIYVRALADGDLAVGLFNLGEEDKFMCFLADELGLSVACGKTLLLTDLWSGEVVRMENEVYKTVVAPHACRLFRARVVSI